MLEGYEDEQAALNNEVVGLENWVASREEIEEWLAIKRIRVTRRCLWVSNKGQIKGQIKGQKGRKKHRKSLQSLELQAFFLVKAVRVELTSESISTGTSPSAAFDFYFAHAAAQKQAASQAIP